MLGSLHRNEWYTWSQSLGSDSTALLGKELWLYGLKNDFSPDLDNPNNAAIECDFSGYPGITTRNIAAGIRIMGYDGATGEMVITLPDPTFGDTMVTTDTLNLPQVFYGWAIGDDSTGLSTTNIVASLRFDNPINVVALAQSINLPNLGVRVNPAAVAGL